MIERFFTWLRTRTGIDALRKDTAHVIEQCDDIEDLLGTYETASKFRNLQIKTAVENRANELALLLKDSTAEVEKAIRSQSTEIDLMREELARHRELMRSFATFQEHEAATYAVQKLEKDEQFRTERPDALVADAVQYAGYYFNEHGWTTPEPARIKSVVLARMGMSKELNGNQADR